MSKVCEVVSVSPIGKTYYLVAISVPLGQIPLWTLLSHKRTSDHAENVF